MFAWGVLFLAEDSNMIGSVVPTERQYLIDTVSSILSAPALVQQVVSRYKLAGSVSDCYLVGSKCNDTYQVETTDGNYYLRVYRHGWRTQEEITAEVELLRFLDWQNVSVATAIPDMEGRFIQRVRAVEGERWIVLFGEAKGRVRPVNAKRSFRLGQAVARIHNCTDQQERDGRRFEHNFEDLILNCPNSSGNKLILNGRDPLPAIEPFLKHRKADFGYLVGVGEHLSRKIKGYHQKTAPWFGVCHGDLHSQNVHFDEDDNITLFDFDHYGYSWRAYDLATFLWDQFNPIHPPVDWSRTAKSKRTRYWNRFLEGYSTLRPLTEPEITSVYHFVLIRHLCFLGMVTSASNFWGRAKLDDNFFDTHLDFIKRWLEVY